MRAFSFALLFLFLAGTAQAQTGKLTGRVTEASTGETMPGVTIYIETLQRGAVSDINGYYVINNVSPGRYTVAASMIGYKRLLVEDVQIRTGLTTELDFAMQEEVIEGEEIVVTAERPDIQRDLTSTRAIVTSEEIAIMPVESVSEIVNLQAGVVNGHFRGGRRDEVGYLVDGVSVTDPFNGGVGVEVETSSIQEIEVISGTFNAEYGQAMSGIVNIVTKDAASQWHGSVQSYLGSYLTGRDHLFYNLGGLDAPDTEDVQVNLEGPVRFLRGLSVFLSGRYFNSGGHLYGRRVYNITDGEPFFPTGDSAFVAMNPYRRYSGNAKLVYNRPSFKISYSLLADDHFNRYYDHAFRLAPDGMMNHYRNNWLHLGQFTHVLSSRTFYTLKYSYNYSGYDGYLYENELDSRYVEPELGLPLSNYTYRYGGNQVGRYDRHTVTQIAQWKLTSQVSPQHSLGVGAEARFHELFASNRELQDMDRNNDVFDPGYPAVGTTFNQRYTRRPWEFSAYVQDKMEYDILIINAGLRFDYFQPNAQLPADLRNPEDIPEFPGAGERKAADATYQFSPRLGVSFPITAQGAIHFAYGHFFQIPSFENLYLDPTFYVEKNRGLYTVMGNPDLKPQRTVMYEAGIQQVLFPNFVLDFTVYYRDIRNLLGTEIIGTYNGFRYARYVNRDYGNVRGFILTLDKRFANFFSAKVDYTYQIAAGNASDPLAVFQDNQADPPVESEKKTVPLDWDQRHTLYASAAVGEPGDWTVGLTWQFGSGMPYTTDRLYGIPIRFENDGRRPVTSVVDLRAEKYFSWKGVRGSLFFYVYNLFDTLNEYGVYGSTGRAGYDLWTRFATPVIGLNTIQEYVDNPAMYSAPREMRLGISIGF